MTHVLLQVGPGECAGSEVVDPGDEFKASFPVVIRGVEGPAGPEVDVHVNRLEPTGPVVQVSSAVQETNPPLASPEPVLGKWESTSGSH